MKSAAFLILFCLVSASLCPLPAWSGQQCSFRATSGLSLGFGELDPAVNATVTAYLSSSTLANMAGDCQGGLANMTIAIEGSGPRQLRHKVTGTNTIAYEITFPDVILPKPGNNSPMGSENGWVTWFSANQIRGQILYSAFVDALAGDYEDTVTIRITP